MLAQPLHEMTKWVEWQVGVSRGSGRWACQGSGRWACQGGVAGGRVKGVAGGRVKGEWQMGVSSGTDLFQV